MCVEVKPDAHFRHYHGRLFDWQNDEMAITLVAATIGNATLDATGKRNLAGTITRLVAYAQFQLRTVSPASIKPDKLFVLA
jgi:hypothetical protein